MKPLIYSIFFVIEFFIISLITFQYPEKSPIINYSLITLILDGIAYQSFENQKCNPVVLFSILSTLVDIVKLLISNQFIDEYNINDSPIFGILEKEFVFTILLLSTLIVKMFAKFLYICINHQIIKYQYKT